MRAEHVEGRPLAVVSLDEVGGVAELLRETQEFVGAIQARTMIHCGPPPAPPGGDVAVGHRDVLAELERPRVQMGDLRGPRPCHHHQDRAQRKEQAELPIASVAVVGEAAHQIEAVAQVSDRLAVLRALTGAFTGREPARGGALVVACLGPVVREQIGRVTRLLREVLLQRPRDRRVQLLPPTPQQRLVGDLLDEDVLEHEHLTRGGALGVDEPRGLQHCDLGAEPLRGERCDRAEQPVAELPPDGAGQLCHELG